MRKSLLFPIGVLAAMLALSLVNGRVMAVHTALWCGQLRQAELSAAAEDWEAAASELRACYYDWADTQTYLHIISRHDTVDDAEAMYQRAMAFCAVQEDSEFRAEMADLRAQLQLLAEMERFSLKNIL